MLTVARRVAGAEQAERLARDVESWVLEHLGIEYPWPGNMRELEQCVRNVLIRGEYRPRRADIDLPDAADELAARLRGATLTADELLQRYVQLVYGQTGNLHETARVLALDWRTVRAKVGGQRDRNGDKP